MAARSSKSLTGSVAILVLAAVSCQTAPPLPQPVLPPNSQGVSPQAAEEQAPFVCDLQSRTPIPLDNLTSMPEAIPLEKSPNQVPTHIRYIALGDSYSAGMGASKDPYSSCMQRSLASWPASIAKWLQNAGKLDGNVWVHAACSGYTTGDIMGKGSLDWLNGETHWITLTAGGNDIGFVKLISACMHLSTQSCSDVVADATEQIESSLTHSVTQLLLDIVARAPNAHVFLAGYPDIVPASSCSSGGFIGRADLDLLRPLIAHLNRHIQAAVEAAVGTTGQSVTFVDVREEFAGHQPCTDKAYVKGMDLMDLKGSFHPNSLGQCAYAHQVWSAMRA